MDRPATMSVLQLGGMQYDILLKGIAWIDAEDYQIVHLETDLMRPIPEVKLSREHQALDYGPVQFQQKGQKLWLPLEAEIYVDAAGKQFHHRHAFSEYRIFSVDSKDKVGTPKTGRYWKRSTPEQSPSANDAGTKASGAFKRYAEGKDV